MPILSIRHPAPYRYRNPAILGERRMMFRPRENYDRRLISFTLSIPPAPQKLNTMRDVFGNPSTSRLRRPDDGRRAQPGFRGPLPLRLHLRPAGSGARVGPGRRRAHDYCGMDVHADVRMQSEI
jgi:Bacterial transglutaminase-like N-terminal region